MEKKLTQVFVPNELFPQSPTFILLSPLFLHLYPLQKGVCLSENLHMSHVVPSVLSCQKMQSFFELWANNDWDSVKFMGLLYFVSHQKYLKAKSKNHLSECVYGGWAFAPVGFMCLLDFTVTVFLIGADWLLHLPEERLFQFIWGDDFSLLQLASYFHSRRG